MTKVRDSHRKRNAARRLKPTHAGVEAEPGQVVSGGELPGVLQAEPNRTGVALRRGPEPPEGAPGQLHRAVVDLEASDWKRPTGAE